jgi:hypothetical protein
MERVLVSPTGYASKWLLILAVCRIGVVVAWVLSPQVVSTVTG